MILDVILDVALVKLEMIMHDVGLLTLALWIEYFHFLLFRYFFFAIFLAFFTCVRSLITRIQTLSRLFP